MIQGLIVTGLTSVIIASVFTVTTFIMDNYYKSQFLENTHFIGKEIHNLLKNPDACTASILGNTLDTTLLESQPFDLKNPIDPSNSFIGSYEATRVIDDWKISFDLHNVNSNLATGEVTLNVKDRKSWEIQKKFLVVLELDTVAGNIKNVVGCNTGYSFTALNYVKRCSSGMVLAGFDIHGNSICQEGTRGPRGSSGRSGSRAPCAATNGVTPSPNRVCVSTGVGSTQQIFLERNNIDNIVVDPNPLPVQ